MSTGDGHRIRLSSAAVRTPINKGFGSDAVAVRVRRFVRVMEVGMLIIFGFVLRSTVVGEGKFECGECGGMRRYVRVERRRWFALFRVPIVKRAVVGTINECTGCGRVVEIY